MRAFILRRVGLLQESGAGSVLIGQPGTADLSRLQNFLSRNGYPCAVLDVAVDEEARALVERTGVQPEELPVMVCPNGTVLKRPTDAEAGMCLGITPELDAEQAARRGRGRRRARQASRPRSMPRPKDCRCWCSTIARTAARPARRRGSRTISASRPAFPAQRWPGAPSARRRNSAPRSRYRLRSHISTAAGRRGGRMIRCGSNWQTAAAFTAAPWWWRRARATASRTFRM